MIDFIAIFWITNQVQPTNPILTRPAIYISIAPGATIQDVVTATWQGLVNSISAIPTAGDLGISLGANLSLMMEA